MAKLTKARKAKINLVVEEVRAKVYGNHMAKVYNDINAIKITSRDSFQTMMRKFYTVMRKHGIKQGTWNENGSRSCNSPQWNMCWNTFKINKILALDIWLALSTPPKDLLGYGTPPKNTKKKTVKRK